MYKVFIKKSNLSSHCYELFTSDKNVANDDSFYQSKFNFCNFYVREFGMTSQDGVLHNLQMCVCVREIERERERECGSNSIFQNKVGTFFISSRCDSLENFFI